MIGVANAINPFPPQEDEAQDSQYKIKRYLNILNLAIENYTNLCAQVGQKGLISPEELLLRHEKFMTTVLEEENYIRRATLIFMENGRLRKLLPQEADSDEL